MKPRRLLASALGLTLLLLAAALSGSGCHRHDAAAGDAEAPKYWCPMHPSYTSPRPGDCPICHMKLVPIPADGAAPTATNVAGRTTIAVSAERAQLIGLRTATVFPRPFTRTLRAFGVVEHDETRLTRVAPRFGGWIERLEAAYTGQEVSAGQPLLSVYSPEVQAAENEYLLAWRQARQETGAGQALLETARRRLELLGLTGPDLRALEERGTASAEVWVRAPVSGHLVRKAAVAGRAFAAGETLFEIAPLDPIWLRLTLAEDEWSLVRTGMTARVTITGMPDRVFESAVDFLYPHFDPATRRGAVRVRLANSDHVLRPDMWATVELEAPLGERLSVPASAVLDTGTRHLAFVRHADGHLEPRQVRIGARTDEWWEVTEGLSAGEKVVSRALFLVDAESQLRAVVSGMDSRSGHEH